MISIFILLLGLVIGSFLNVVISRLPEDQSVVRPASHCPECETPIFWKDNIPVLSYLFLKGKCRKCKVKISVQYPIVELLTAILFLACYHRFELTPLLILRDLPFVAILIAITFIDLKHRIIPDELNAIGFGIGISTSYWSDTGIVGALGGAGLGFGVFYFFSWTYEKLRGRVGLGGGDVKLLGMLGAFVGPMGIFAVIFISSILGTVIGLIVGLVGKLKKSDDGTAVSLMGVAIPFGPFLVVAALYVYLLGSALWLPFMIRT